MAGALFAAAEAVVCGTSFEMFESLLILAVVSISGLLSSRALAGGPAIGFLPANAQDVFIGAGTVALAFYPAGVLPLAFSRFHGGGAAWRPPRHAGAGGRRGPRR